MIQHRKFIKDNQLEGHLPDLIEDMVARYDKTEASRKDCTPTHCKEVDGLLKEADEHILSALFEHFEDELEGNELEEEMPPTPEQKPCPCKHKTKIEKWVKEGRKIVQRKEMEGMRLDIKQRVHDMGDYELIKETFSYHFRIVTKMKKTVLKQYKSKVFTL